VCEVGAGGEHTYDRHVDAAVEHLVDAIKALPPQVANDDIAAAFAAADLLAAWLSGVVDAIDPTIDGAVTVPHWLRTRAGRSYREAGMTVHRAELLRWLPHVTAAWSDGRLSTGQVDAVVARVSARTAPLFAEHEAELVPRLIDLSVRDTDMAMRRWAAYADAVVDAPAREPSERTVHLSNGVDGWGELSGHLDLAGTEVLSAALDAATTPDVDGEPARSRGQRRADALVAVSRHYLDHADATATSRRSRPDVHVVVSLADLEQGAGRSFDGEVLDPATIGALLCDAGVHRIVTDGASVVLDVGRTARTVSHHMFSALAIRDGGCRFPGCDRPVSWCEAHHVVPWQHGGRTEQSNLVLLCWRHHHDFAHHPQWHLKLLPDTTVEVTKPDGTTLTSHPPPSATERLPGTKAHAGLMW
jgi:Domain of unknown function (DUF222)/HNH endonuclease